MSASSVFALTTRVSRVLRELETIGITVEVGGDFQRYRSLRNTQFDRPDLYPMFDVTKSYVDASNGFWVCGFDGDGNVVHTQAARLLDLRHQRLDEHLWDHRHKYITPDTTPDPDQTSYIGPRSLTEISGNVCYHGDFWLLSRGLGGPRSYGATGLLSRLLMEMVSQVWAPDYIFALVPKRLANKGAHLRYGYVHCEAGRWIGPDKQITDEDYLIWMNQNELRFQVLEQPVSLAETSQMATISSSELAIDAQG